MLTEGLKTSALRRPVLRIINLVTILYVFSTCTVQKE